MATFRKKRSRQYKRRNTRRNIRRNTRRKYIKARKSSINRRSRKSLEGGLKFPSFSSFAPSFLTRRKVGIAPTDVLTPTTQGNADSVVSTPIIQGNADADGSTPITQGNADNVVSTTTTQDSATPDDAILRGNNKYETDVFSQDILRHLHSDPRFNRYIHKSRNDFIHDKQNKILKVSENNRDKELNGKDNYEWEG
jgi:hypothetical protein